MHIIPLAIQSLVKYSIHLKQIKAAVNYPMAGPDVIYN